MNATGTTTTEGRLSGGEKCAEETQATAQSRTAFVRPPAPAGVAELTSPFAPMAAVIFMLPRILGLAGRPFLKHPSKQGVRPATTEAAFGIDPPETAAPPTVTPSGKGFRSGVVPIACATASGCPSPSSAWKRKRSEALGSMASRDERAVGGVDDDVATTATALEEVRAMSTTPGVDCAASPFEALGAPHPDNIERTTPVNANDFTGRAWHAQSEVAIDMGATVRVARGVGRRAPSLQLRLPYDAGCAAHASDLRRVSRRTTLSRPPRGPFAIKDGVDERVDPCPLLEGVLDEVPLAPHTELLGDARRGRVPRVEVGDDAVETERAEGVSQKRAARLGDVATAPMGAPEYPPHLGLSRFGPAYLETGAADEAALLVRVAKDEREVVDKAGYDGRRDDVSLKTGEALVEGQLAVGRIADNLRIALIDVAARRIRYSELAEEEALGEDLHGTWLPSPRAPAIAVRSSESRPRMAVHGSVQRRRG